LATPVVPQQLPFAPAHGAVMPSAPETFVFPFFFYERVRPCQMLHQVFLPRFPSRIPMAGQPLIGRFFAQSLLMSNLLPHEPQTRAHF